MQAASPPAAVTRVLLTLPMTMAVAGRAPQSADPEHWHGPVKRLLPLDLTGRCRPKPARRVAPKQPDGKTSPFLFRFYEAAVRDLTQPAITSHTKLPQTGHISDRSTW
jgi:hypothetical protein